MMASSGGLTIDWGWGDKFQNLGALQEEVWDCQSWNRLINQEPDQDGLSDVDFTNISEIDDSEDDATTNADGYAAWVAARKAHGDQFFQQSQFTEADKNAFCKKEEKKATAATAGAKTHDINCGNNTLQWQDTNIADRSGDFVEDGCLSVWSYFLFSPLNGTDPRHPFY